MVLTRAPRFPATLRLRRVWHLLGRRLALDSRAIRFLLWLRFPAFRKSAVVPAHHQSTPVLRCRRFVAIHSAWSRLPNMNQSRVNFALSMRPGSRNRLGQNRAPDDGQENPEEHGRLDVHCPSSPCGPSASTSGESRSSSGSGGFTTSASSAGRIPSSRPEALPSTSPRIACTPCPRCPGRRPCGS